LARSRAAPANATRFVQFITSPNIGRKVSVDASGGWY
jgi:hypothetical protein